MIKRRFCEREDYARWFRGIGRSYALLCDQCAPYPEQAPLVTVCSVCFRAIEKEPSWQGVLGEMQFAERATNLRFAHSVATRPTGLTEPIVDIQPDDLVLISSIPAACDIRDHAFGSNDPTLGRPAG